MSGGSLDYVYSRVDMAADEIRSNCPGSLHQAFADHLAKVSKALHDIEWVLSDDYGAGDDEKAIREVLGAAKLDQDAGQSAARKALAEIIAGLDGTPVTPGIWSIEPDHAHPDEVHHVVGDSEIVAGLDGICSPHRMNDRSFSEDLANMHHIARCNPVALRSIADLVASQDARIASVDAVHRMEIADMSDRFREVNVERVFAQMKPDTVELIARANAYKDRITELEAQISEMRARESQT